MKVKCKWALALAPFVLTGCNDLIDPGQKPVGTSGDDVQFYVAKDREARTMYQDDWDATDANGKRTPNAIYWGNYQGKKDECINIYCPNTERGFAKYLITPNAQDNKDVAATVVRMSEIGVQWGPESEPHTFYAFYPADKASTLTKNGAQHIVRATVDYQQSPVGYKWKLNSAKETSASTLNLIEGMDTYINTEYDATAGVIDKNAAKTIYGMPDMEAAVMVARHDVPTGEFGKPVPLQFNVLADVLDITLNGPTTPNTLGGNGNAENPGLAANFIQIQSVTLEYVDRPQSQSDPMGPTDDPKAFKIDHTHPIVGSFDLDMAKVVEGYPATGTENIKDMISNVQGSASVILNTATNSGEKTYYPTLFVRTFSDTGADGTPVNKDQKCLDHLRLRAFLIPGQVTADDLYKLRVHIQTNCGDYYKMLEVKNQDGTGNESGYVSSRIYPIKMGYFKSRSESDFDLKQWIGQLDPNICITELSIPGAWHAANSDNQGGKTLTEMYNAGVRAFEVHTKNGPVLRKYGDMNAPFDLSASTKNFQYPFVYQTGERIDVSNHGNPSGSGRGSDGNYTYDGTTYTRRREVTATATVTKVITTDEYIVPKFWIRLYRSTSSGAEISAGTAEPLSTAIINMASVMNASGLMFLEVGQKEATGIRDVPYRSKTTVETKFERVNVTVKGYQWATTDFWGTPTWQNVYTWDTDGIDFSGITPTTNKSQPDAGGTFNLSAEEAWAIAVNSCFERLATEHNPKTGKSILYSGELNRNTTIKDVQGMVIAKVNTNMDNNYRNEARYLWEAETPALFSRWLELSGKEPRTINLQWKSPVAAFVDNVEGNLHEGLRWCYTELDDIKSIQERKGAIDMMNSIAYGNYQGGYHRTFYETSLGGFLNGGSSVANCQAVAKQLHPYVLSKLADPSRQNVPLGLVFMNYVIPPAGEEDTYKSGELIRAIINNNKAFLLHRPDETEFPVVEDNVDSHFNNNSLSPLK